MRVLSSLAFYIYACKYTDCGICRQIPIDNKQVLQKRYMMTEKMNMMMAMGVGALVALAAVHWIYLKVLRIAKVKGLVDNPDARKLQKEPVPVLGGMAVFFGLMTGLLAFCAVTRGWGVPMGELAYVMLGAGVMLYVGSLDDVLGLTPRARLVVEVLVMLGLVYGSGMCVDSLHGLWGIHRFSWWMAVPLTVFAGVGLINAYNMVDGVNGLSSGLCIACNGIMAVICWKRGEYADCALAVCFAASLFPFLLHNVFGRKSKMFIGDGGTMVMGLLVGWFVMRGLSDDPSETLTGLAHGGTELGVVAMMLAVASVPVADTVRVMTARVMRGESAFHPDKTHLHHVFIAVGVSHSVTALSEIVLNLLVVAVWYVSYRLGASVEWQLYIVCLAGIALVWGMYFFLSRMVRNNPEAAQAMNWMRKTHLGHKHWWLAFQQWLDKGALE